jgi:hypothetical protein
MIFHSRFQFRGVLPGVCDLETSTLRWPRTELAVVLHRERERERERVIFHGHLF